jgi:type IV pilus assembly protein PilY1
MTATLASRFRLLSILSSLVLSFTTSAAPTDIHDEPLAHALSAVKPNIMFILDDSGSMDWDYLPDYVKELSDNTNTNNCRSGANDNGDLIGTLTQCQLGDVPYTTAAFNAQYYNPNTYYQPSPAPGGLDAASRNMTSANTAGWTQVPNNGYNLGQGTRNLINNYPDRVWCTTNTPVTSDLTNPAICRTNAEHSYPNQTFRYGTYRNDNSMPSALRGTPILRPGAPYYYRIATPQYCTDKTLTSCQAQTDATHRVAAPVRFCTNNSLSNCQAKWVKGSYIYPYFAGQFSLTNVTAALATARIIVNNSYSDSSVSISTILAGNVNLLGNTTVTASNGTNSSIEQGNAATAIRNAINANTVSGVGHGYTATVNNNIVTVTAPNPVAPATHVDYNGVTLQPVLAAGTARAVATLTVDSVNTGTNTQRSVSSLSIGGVNIIAPNTNNPVYLTAGQTAISAAAIASRINNYNNGLPWEYTAAVNANVVTIYAPQDMGAVPNGLTLAVVRGTRVGLSHSTAMSGGSGGANLALSTTSFSGGTNAAPEGWTSSIQFERTSIVPTLNGIAQTYQREAGADRPDCASTTACTYEEEMTNFANWYAYYRTRLMSAKSATGRAFSGINDDVRVGFITINPGSSSSNVSGTRYLKIADFSFDTATNSGHKKLWYDKLYGLGTNGGTPLRQALSRVGRLYAGQYDDINQGIPIADDPIQHSCQPNFAILTSDGYWNGSGGRTVRGIPNQGSPLANIGNEDNQDSGYSKRDPDGAYDGGLSGATGTLADVAMYYYKNDLRPNLADNVLTSSRDNNKKQHMTTFTVGLGLSGVLDFDPAYEIQAAGDFAAIVDGTKDWPVPVMNSESALDDLWHAAVNGRGTFYSARSPREFSNALADTLTQMRARTGAASAASVSNLQPSPGDNFVFTAQYQTATWAGDVLARTLDTVTGTISSAAPLWSARAFLDGRNYDSRVIFTYDETDSGLGGNKLKHFCWPGTAGANCSDGTGLTSGTSGEQRYFNTNQLPQYANWSAVQKADATGASLVNFLRGDRSLESQGGVAPTDLYRSRFSILGDIIHAQPAYSRVSPFEYFPDTDPHYTLYKELTKDRLGTVFVAANDGMLHAFETDVNRDAYYQTAGIGTSTDTDDLYEGNNVGNGEERWAYIPGILLPHVHKLAGIPYAHRYFADASPVIGDICVGHTKTSTCAAVSDWRTILVAGLNAGGRGYYALDITDPSNPKALWELAAGTTCLNDTEANSGLYSSDCNIGLTFGEPLIVKRPYDGRWVVIVSSGYNNFNPGNGQGYLYILDAVSGKILQRIGTGIGSAGTVGQGFTDANPSGLGKINGFVENPMHDNTVLAVYGGDLEGNLWRFDLTPGSTQTPNPGYATAFRLTTFQDALGKAQPITVRPELAKTLDNGVYYRVVMLGTGRYLGEDDPEDTSQQTIYAVRDDLSSTPIAGRSEMLMRAFFPSTTAPTDATKRESQGATRMNWIDNKGWYIDLPDTGERVNVDPVFQKGILTVASNVPNDDVCLGGGYAWINFFRIDGTGKSTNPGTSIVVGATPVILGDKLLTLVQDSSGNVIPVDPEVDPFPPIQGKRVSWRELISE